MLSKKIEEICNQQVEKEGYSSNLYLAMAAWAENQGYAGVAAWLYAQADEEKMHMLKFISYINERGGRVIIPAFQKPPEEYKGIKEMFAEILKHEQYISASINDIVALCIEEKDFTTNNWIQWFVAEQIEEESSVQAIIDKLNLVGDKNMYMFDRDIVGMRGVASAEE
jgi:ferritin